jgi:hypothetical protein
MRMSDGSSGQRGSDQWSSIGVGMVHLMAIEGAGVWSHITCGQWQNSGLAHGDGGEDNDLFEEILLNPYIVMD